MIIIVFGLPASGKSYFAKAISQYMDALLISSDQLRKKNGQTARYTVKAKNLIYDEMLRVMKNAVISFGIVVLDATFHRSHTREMFIQTAGEISERICFLEIRASAKTIRKRLSQVRPDSDADFAVYQKISKFFEPMSQLHLILYSDRMPLRQMMLSALQYLNEDRYEYR